MDSDEIVKSVFSRFTNIVNGLNNLGKTHSDGDLVNKVIRSLSKT